MKTIGVLGGLGPQATMDFEARVHRVAQALIPPQANSGYPPMVVVYFRQAPIATDADHLPVFPMQPNPQILDTVARLGAWADFIVITANGPHMVADALAQAAGRPILSMIDLTLAEVQRRGWQQVGVVGLGEPRVYTEPLQQAGLAYETPDPALQQPLDQAILALMEGRDTPEMTAAAQAVIDAFRAHAVDGIILGCTEIPLLLKAAAAAPDLINPAQLLAEAAVREALA